MGYHRAGFEVVGVDINPQPHYPFEFHQADALTYPLDGFDTYHASPPCQQFTVMQNVTKSQDKHPNLIPAIRERLKETKRLYVIENVLKSPLDANLMLCGTHFGLNTQRHRYFECPWMPMTLIQPCNHIGMYSKWRFKTHPEWCVGEKEQLAAAMGIDWIMSRQEVREAIPPAYTEYIGKYLMQAFLAEIEARG